MDRSLIPTRYAKALLDYSKEVGMDKQVYSNIKHLAQNLSDHPEIKKAIENPIISIDVKRKLIMTATGDNVCGAFSRFVDLIIQNKREGSILLIILKFRDIYRKSNNLYYAKLTTVTSWKEESIEKLKKTILGDRPGSIEFHSVIDENIIGGFIVELDGNLLDASILGQLKLINKRVIEKNIRIV